MSKELWGYVSGTIPCPKVTSVPKPPVPDAAGIITTAQKEAYEDKLITFNTANEKFVKWNIEDDKAIGRDWQGCEVPLTLCQGFGKGEGKGLCFSTPPNPSLHMFTLHTLHTPEIY